MHPHIEKHFTAGDSVRDVVIGMSDGLTVPFALAAGQINLSSGAIVTSWIPALVAAGLLTQARATAVLTP